MFNIHTNWLAVFASAIAYMVIGFLWYGPLFAEPWMKLIGKSKKDLEREMKNGSMPKTYGLSFVSALVTSYVMSILIEKFDITNVQSAVSLAVWVWLGFVAATYATLVLYEKRPLKLYAINVGYYLVTFIVAAVILTIWV